MQNASFWFGFLCMWVFVLYMCACLRVHACALLVLSRMSSIQVRSYCSAPLYLDLLCDSIIIFFFNNCFYLFCFVHFFLCSICITLAILLFCLLHFTLFIVFCLFVMFCLVYYCLALLIMFYLAVFALLLFTCNFCSLLVSV